MWGINEVVVNNVFAYTIASEIINDNELKPQTVEECRHQNDLPKLKVAIQAELDLTTKLKVFGSIVKTPEDVKSVRYKWVFVRKRNELNEIVRYMENNRKNIPSS